MIKIKFNKFGFLAISLIFYIFFAKSKIFERVNLIFYDNAFRFFIKQERPSNKIILVAIDDKSISKYGRWPWSRKLLAEKLSKLKNAEIVILDILFLEKTKEDTYLAKVFKQFKKVILPVAFEKNYTKLPVFRGQNINYAHPYIKASPDGITRFIEPYILSFPALGISFKKFNYDNKNNFYIDWSFHTIKEISISDIDKFDFKNKIVFVGITATGLREEFLSPLKKIWSGAEIHTLIANQLMKNKKIIYLSHLLILIFVFLIYSITCQYLFNLTRKYLIFPIFIFAPILISIFVFSISKCFLPPIEYTASVIILWFLNLYSHIIHLIRQISKEVGANGSLKDILPVSSLEKVLHNLLRLKNFIENVLKNIHSGIVVVENSKGKIIYVNLEGKKILENEQFMKEFRSLEGEIEIGEKEFFIRKKELSPFNETLIIIDDITELKKSIRLKEEFISFLSHELRNPLTTIIGFSELSLKSEEEEAIGYMKLVNEEAVRLYMFVVSLLHLFKFENKKKIETGEIFDIKDVVESAMRTLSLMIEESGKKVINEVGNGKVKGDRYLIDHVVLNLIDNSVRYSKNLVILRGGEEGRYVYFEVENDSEPLSEEEKERVFDRYWRGRRGGGGAGIGLAFCKKVIELHNGKIWVENGENLGGPKFKFVIPK